MTPELLTAVADVAKTQGVSAEAALLATGLISESGYYRALARHLGVYFIEGNVAIAPLAPYPQALHAGFAPLDPLDPLDQSAFIAAPQGEAISTLIASVPPGELRGRLAITTPSNLSNLLRTYFRKRILRDASFALIGLDPSLSAKGRAQRFFPLGVAAGSLLAICATLTWAGAGAYLATAMSLAFLAIVVMRVIVCAAGIEAKPVVANRLSDEHLPPYSIVVALYREARVVPQLVSALEQIDYPTAKLDIKFIIEEDDDETFAALRKSVRRFGYEVIVAPNGTPRTKPRALNVALPLLRGEFVAIFDAEDLPDILQLRDAAERFAGAAPTVACLQARLAIDNLEGWLPRLFAIEYAALFDVINIGFADFKLPFPLGGSSNHFRTDILRKIGGWDAWNVTEDADI
ncbi:MAG TPA: glycosyltransferase, partial [Methylovirgula sp.]